MKIEKILIFLFTLTTLYAMENSQKDREEESLQETFSFASLPIELQDHVMGFLSISDAAALGSADTTRQKLYKSRWKLLDKTVDEAINAAYSSPTIISDAKKAFNDLNKLNNTTIPFDILDNKDYLKALLLKELAFSKTAVLNYTSKLLEMDLVNPSNVALLFYLNQFKHQLPTLSESQSELSYTSENFATHPRCSLNLSRFNLSYLPENIGNLKSLKYLYIISNQLTFLPDGIKELNNLELLDMSSNQLTSLPKSIINLENLEALSLRNNPNLPLMLNIDLKDHKVIKKHLEKFFTKQELAREIARLEAQIEENTRRLIQPST